MSHIRQQVKMEEIVHVWIPKRRLSRPFPLRWGLLALALFGVFAAVTQLQFSRISDEKIHEARMDTYRSDVAAYNVAVKANEDCLTSIELRETYKSLFTGISDLFTQTAELPVILLPNNVEAITYESEILNNVETLIREPINETLNGKPPSECPQIPVNKPVEP